MKSVFIIASDDMDWCQENLHKNNDWKLEFTNDFYGRLGQNNPLFFDFAVLSAVDVSVANSASKLYRVFLQTRPTKAEPSFQLHSFMLSSFSWKKQKWVPPS